MSWEGISCRSGLLSIIGREWGCKVSPLMEEHGNRNDNLTLIHYLPYKICHFLWAFVTVKKRHLETEPGKDWSDVRGVVLRELSQSSHPRLVQSDHPPPITSIAGRWKLMTGILHCQWPLFIHSFIHIYPADHCSTDALCLFWGAVIASLHGRCFVNVTCCCHVPAVEW